MPLDGLVLGGALLSGLLGGAHCAAMCGGIATGFSTRQRGGWWVALQPNLGRMGGYALAGAIVGGVGHGLLDIARLPHLAVALRAAVGLVLIVAALRLLDRRGRFAFLGMPGAGLWRWLRPLQQRLLPADSAGKRIALGMLWGWMPCGLSTTLLAAAWLQASAAHGALTMAAFGLGTLPVMLPLTWAGARFGQRLQRGGWRTAMGLCVLLAGVLTLTAPWLMHAPALHGVLAALGCRSLPA
ncbi:sulfite exporter TauE/SafE family protein [Pseudoxanthomonas helianthi]|uniref:Sulfite exporter TauE/SafE family protein n=1 Tax=Pseudoxanthomonas helianthi TaxID=1453541 RepID=A0A940X1T9_9GAMM|nr:sulfite exporter TauE/SafE family protein [Pseudoxanthomonas helianthi]MBP3983486.1 sulfite exporter TauE/SafE family protein [Pseudoxanthomonas helianthi]